MACSCEPLKTPITNWPPNMPPLSAVLTEINLEFSSIKITLDCVDCYNQSARKSFKNLDGLVSFCTASLWCNSKALYNASLSQEIQPAISRDVSCNASLSQVKLSGWCRCSVGEMDLMQGGAICQHCHTLHWSWTWSVLAWHHTMWCGKVHQEIIWSQEFRQW